VNAQKFEWLNFVKYKGLRFIMKSIIQEAPSIAKAIEQGWQKAGKPQSFSIKILELEEKNFLGMTKKPAKVAFFFEEKSIPVKKTLRQAQDDRRTRRRQIAPAKRVEKKQEKKPRQITKKTVKKSPWTDQMESSAKKWTQDMLHMMKFSHIKYSTTTFKNNIKFHFEAPLIKNKNEQKILFSSFALLLMQTLRNKFKKQFRNLNAVFTTD